jgi:branched-chain amino acid transport system substrate-binding protein
MKKNVLLVVMFIASAVLLFAQTSRGQQSFSIGLNVSLTKTPILGYAMKNACELAVEDINHGGGINGISLKVLVDDNKLLPTEAVLISKKTLPNVHATIVGTSGSCFLAVMPVASEFRVPIFGPGMGTPAITERGNKYVFRTHFNDNVGAHVFVNYLVKTLKYKRIAVANEDRDYGIGGAASVKQALSRYDLKPVAEEKFSTGMVDFTPIVARLKELNPEAIVIWGFPNETSTFVKQAREAGIKALMGGCNAFEGDPFNNLAGAKGNDVVYISPYFADPTDLKLQSFIKRYENKYKTTPDAYTVNSYDTVQIIAKALMTSGDNKEKFRDAIRSTKWQGLNQDLGFDEHGDNTRPIHLVKWQNGKRVKIETVDITKLILR